VYKLLRNGKTCVGLCQQTPTVGKQDRHALAAWEMSSMRNRMSILCSTNIKSLT